MKTFQQAKYGMRLLCTLGKKWVHRKPICRCSGKMFTLFNIPPKNIHIYNTVCTF